MWDKANKRNVPFLFPSARLRDGKNLANNIPLQVDRGKRSGASFFLLLLLRQYLFGPSENGRNFSFFLLQKGKVEQQRKMRISFFFLLPATLAVMTQKLFFPYPQSSGLLCRFKRKESRNRRRRGSRKILKVWAEQEKKTKKKATTDFCRKSFSLSL